MQLHIWKQNSETTLDNFRKKYCVMLDPQIHDENSKWTLRFPMPPTTCRVNSNVLFKPFQDLRDLVLTSFTTSAPTKLPPKSAISLVPSLPLCFYLASEQVALSALGMFQAQSLCLGILICWNVPSLQIHVTQSLYCPKSFLRVNFHDCCYKNKKH